jgi:uncharacterized protein GlcG (DUF336 family)
MSKLDRREALRAAQVAVVRRPASSRTSVPIMGMSEADAKAAWLAQTSAGYIRRDAYVPEGQPYNSWLAPSAPMLTLEAADEMSNVALREAIARGFKPVCVCVVDAAGIPLVTKRMPGSMGLSPEFAMAKASTCIGMQCSSRELGAKYIDEQGIGPKMPQTLAMELCGAANGKPIVHFPGGVLLRDGAGNIVGAIAVSGASSDEDEHCAILAAHTVGLVTEPPASRLG